MAKYYGYVTLPTDSYDSWRAAVNGNGYNVDYAYGCQCWDLAAEFWWNVGFPQGYPTLAGTGSAYGVWDDREQNAGNAFDLIYNASEVKRGDVIIFNYFAGNPYGHVGFADEDYDGSGRIQVLSENNGGTPDPEGGAYTNVAGYNMSHFRGAFRYKAWETTPPTPTPTKKRSNFPWVLYARKFRNR